MENEYACLSETASRAELEREIGRLYMELRLYKTMLQKEQDASREQLIRFAKNEESRIEAFDRLNKRCESLQKDLDKALSLADLSKQGADTKNPFIAFDNTIKHKQ